MPQHPTPDPEGLSEAGEAAASVRFQPVGEDVHVCPACYHIPHWGEMCAFCLCFKIHPASADADGDADARDDAQPVDDPVEIRVPAGRHRREVPKSSKLQRLQKWARRG